MKLKFEIQGQVSLPKENNVSNLLDLLKTHIL